MNLGQVLMDVLLPIFLIFGVGFILGKKKNLEPQPLAHVSIYILLPSLVFASFLDGDILNTLTVTGVYIVVFTGVLYLICVLISRLLKFDKALESAFLLSVLFTNSGNYGVPLCKFAFGDEGMVNALAYMMYGSVIMYTLAVYIASRGHCSTRESFANIFKIPLVYAVGLAVAFSFFTVEVPTFIEKPVALLGSAAIPVTMVLLGVQLSRTEVQKDYKPLVLSNILRLLLSPLLGILITNIMGIEGLLRSVLIVESSVPTAVNSALIAIEFNAKPGYVSTMVLVSTVLSIFSLSVLLLYLT